MVKSDGCDSPQIQIENIMINTVIHIFINILFFFAKAKTKVNDFLEDSRAKARSRIQPSCKKRHGLCMCCNNLYSRYIYILLYGHHFGGIS